MHDTNKYQSAITLFSRGGGSWRYSSISALTRELGLAWLSAHVADEFRAFSHTECRGANGEYHNCFGRDAGPCYRVPVYVTADYVLRNDAGLVVTYGQCWAAWCARQKQRTWFQPGYNGGPVAGTGRKRRGRAARREVSHANALRAAVTFEDEGEVPVRHSRSKALEQDPWGDYCFRHLERNWKRFRKTQWK